MPSPAPVQSTQNVLQSQTPVQSTQNFIQTQASITNESNFLQQQRQQQQLITPNPVCSSIQQALTTSGIENMISQQTNATSIPQSSITSHGTQSISNNIVQQPIQSSTIPVPSSVAQQQQQQMFLSQQQSQVRLKH